jgi:polyphenol oxidase
MPFHQSGEIRYFSFENLSQAGVTNAIFTRRGGVSPAPWGSLNLNWFNGDHPDRVAENHRRAFQAVGRELSSMGDARQVHGVEVYIYTRLPSENNLAQKPEADALLTNHPHVTLQMRYADCVPVLLYDPRNQVAGIAHAGWRGTVKRVAAAAVTQMVSRFNSKPDEILAGIGPSICVDHYEVGLEVMNQAAAMFGEHTPCLVRKNGSVKFDLWAANRQVLEDVGVKNIEISELCTASDLENWFSYRAENQKTGGFAALIGLE